MDCLQHLTSMITKTPSSSGQQYQQWNNFLALFTIDIALDAGERPAYKANISFLFLS